MEHIMSISFDFDTSNVKRIVEEKAARQIIGDIKDDIEKTMFYHGGWRSNETDPNQRSGLQEFLIERFDAFLRENKDEIIESAVKEAVKKLVRTKAVQDRVAAIREEEDHDR